MRIPATLAVFFITSWAQTALGDELAERNALKAEARAAFLADRFDELERLAERYRTTDRFTGSGAPKENLLDDGIAEAYRPPKAATEDHYNQVTKKALAWVSQFPRSPLAHTVVALSYLGHAGYFRGTGYADSVPQENWAPFYTYSRLALQHLTTNKAAVAVDLRWYITMMTVGRNLGWDYPVIQGLLEEAEAKFPDPGRLHNSYIIHLLPKWYGDPQILDKFIVAAALRSTTRTADEHYARLYGYAAQVNFQHDLYEKSLADWGRMRQGFTDIVAKYPTQWNRNIFAYHACIAKDKTRARALLQSLNSGPILSLWEPKGAETYARCKQFVEEP